MSDESAELENGQQRARAFHQGHPVPFVSWKDVAAGLLALGSTRFAGLPGRIQWLEWAKRSPITVAGAAPE